MAYESDKAAEKVLSQSQMPNPDNADWDVKAAHQEGMAECKRIYDMNMKNMTLKNGM